MHLEHLPPGSIVELDDIIMGGRKLGLVDDTGVGYYDIHGEGELPKPLHTDLQPLGLGVIAEWIARIDEQQIGDFNAAWEFLTNRGFDLLTIARGMRWGLANASFDPATLEKMGQAATETVLAGRATLTKALGASL